MDENRARGGSSMNEATSLFFSKLEDSAITTLEQVRDKTFKNETVEIDGKRFTNCEFYGCSLRYAGGDVEFGIRCDVENCRPQFTGPARRTVLLLHALRLLAFDPFDKDATAQVRP